MILGIEFARPERLWWIAAIPVILGAALALRARRRPWPASIASLIVRSAMLSLIVVALAEPVHSKRETLTGGILAVVDWSRSVPDRARDAALDRVESWARAAGSPARVIAFGERARIVADWHPDAPASRPSGRGGDLSSDPSPALDLARVLGARSARDRIVVFTDGAVVDPAEGLDFWPHAKPVVLSMEANGGRNARVLETLAKSEGGESDAWSIVVRGASSETSAGTLHVIVDGIEARALPVNVSAGEFELVAPLPLATPGRHVVGVWLDSGDDEPLDDHGGVVVDVPERPGIVVAAPDGRSLLASALHAQELPVEVVRSSELITHPEIVDRAGVLVVDRVPVDDLSSAAVMSRISNFVQRGGGLMYLPSERRGELVAAEGRAFLGLLPLIGRPLAPEKPEEPPPQLPPDGEGVKPPEPDKKKTEKREAPTLGLLLLIDCSGSMKGQKLRLAKQAAVAAAEVLHPEDKIGVVAFNDTPIEVLPMCPAGDRAEVVDRIGRIQAGGGTDFGPALDEARGIFGAMKLKIKHCVLLSDGESRPGKLFDRVDALVREGVTLSTVGIGTEARFDVLSELAARGRGKYQPAYSAEEIPQVITVEAERVVTQYGARRRIEVRDDTTKDEKPGPQPPNPQTKDPPHKPDPAEEAPRKTTPVMARWPAAYLKGVHPENCQGVLDWQRADATPSAWISLATDGGDPLVVHTYLGFGRIVATTVPFEGVASGPFLQWDDYANLVGQIARFLMPSRRPQRLLVTATAHGRLVTVEVTDVESNGAVWPALDYELRDQRGRVLTMPIETLSPGRIQVALPPQEPIAWLEARVSVRGEPGDGAGGAAVAPAPEIAERGLRLDGLKTLAARIGGTFVPVTPDTFDVARETRETREPVGFGWLVALPALFVLDVVLKRLWRGETR